MGRSWESGIKSLKTPKRVIGEQMLSYEEFNMVLVYIEVVLNSRTLTRISSDANDLSILTPGYTLTMEPLSANPDQGFENVPIPCLKR